MVSELSGSLLRQDAVLEAAHDLYCVVVNDRWDEIGRERDREWAPFRAEVDRLDDATQLSIMWRLIGRAEQAWGYDVGLVFHHMGIESIEDQQRGLYYLFMGCMGHGVSLADDHQEALDKASSILNRYTDRTFDSHPFDFEEMDWRMLAEENYPDEDESDED